MNKSIVTTLALLCLGGTSASSAAEEVQEPYCEHSVNECASRDYAVFKTASCQRKSLRACKRDYQAPGVNEIQCLLNSGMYECSTWSTGDEVSYAYYGSTSIDVSDSGPTYSSTVWVTCKTPGVSGVLTVTASSPYGISSSDSVTIPCGNAWD